MWSNGLKKLQTSIKNLKCNKNTWIPYILVACNGGLQRKKINTDDHLSMCSCSGGTRTRTALNKAVKFRISWSAWCTFSRGGTNTRVRTPRKWAPWCSFSRMVHKFASEFVRRCAFTRGERIRCYTGLSQGWVRCPSGLAGELAPLTPFYSVTVPVVHFFGRSSCLLWRP